MEVDYSANFGIGFKVDLTEDIDEEEDFWLDEYLEENLGEKYSYFEVGSDFYTGETDGYYVVLPKILDFNTAEKDLNDLEVHLKSIKLKPSERGLVGGLKIW